MPTSTQNKKNRDTGVQDSGGNGTTTGVAVVQSKAWELSVAEAYRLVDKFGRDAHEIGMRARRLGGVTIAAVLMTGKEIEEMHKREGADQGRASKYGAWCAEYLPWLGRKTCDRWRAAYLAFQGFVEDEDRREELAAAWENLQLTVLYRMSERGVPLEAKELVLDKAKTRPVTPLMADAIIEECGGKRAVPATPARKTSSKKFEAKVDEVRIVVRFPVDREEKDAIEAAIRELTARLSK